MIKIFAMIPRREDVSIKQFHDHWRHPHGTMGRQISTIRKYVQSHRCTSPHMGENAETYEGIAEVWMDSLSDANGLATEPTYVAHAVPDEPNFIDLERLVFFLTEEEVLKSGPDHGDDVSYADSVWFDDDRCFSIKLIQIHGESWPSWDIATELELGTALNCVRLVHCFPARGAYDKVPPPFSGVREMWWPTLTLFEEGVARAPDAFSRLVGATSVISILAQAERFK